jgi:murein L,D-transpeptidase YcbB/YkuD
VEKFVPVKASLPVYIGYFTAFVDAEGELNFRKDIYNRDERLYTMLTSGK